MTIKEFIAENYESVVLFENYDYESALIGVTTDERAVYDYDKMIDYLMNTGDFNDVTEAIEWIDYNTIRALGYAGDNAPIIVYPIDEKNF